jgi:selenide,water dikinase
VTWSDGINSTYQTILSDPQTSGGLLVSASPDAVDSVLALFHEMGFKYATVIGELVDNSANNSTCVIVAP